jgi:hypothetical protein
VDPDWARKWPAEQIWRVRKPTGGFWRLAQQ